MLTHLTALRALDTMVMKCRQRLADVEADAFVVRDVLESAMKRGEGCVEAWSKHPPACPGYYFWREAVASVPEVFQVVAHGTDQVRVVDGTGGLLFVEELDGGEWWSQRIADPRI